MPKTTVPVILPPYLASVVFAIVDVPGAEGIEILPPDDRQHPSSSVGNPGEEARVGHRLGSITIARPEPGLWIVIKPDPESRFRILSHHFFPRGILVEPSTSQPLRRDASTFLTYRLTDDRGDALEILADYPLLVRFGINRPDGTMHYLTAEHRPDLGPATFRSREAVRCTLAGHYWAETTVTTHDRAGKRVTILRDRWSSFAVE